MSFYSLWPNEKLRLSAGQVCWDCGFLCSELTEIAAEVVFI